MRKVEGYYPYKPNQKFGRDADLYEVKSYLISHLENTLENLKSIDIDSPISIKGEEMLIRGFNAIDGCIDRLDQSIEKNKQ